MNLDPATDIAVGKVVRSWGRHGAVVVEPLTHDVRRFDALTEVGVRTASGDRVSQVVGVRYDRTGRPLLTLADVESIDAAEALRGATLVVPQSMATRPFGDGYFDHELLGCEVVTRTGEVLGRVQRLIEVPDDRRIMEIRGEGGEVLIPVVESIVVTVDAASRRIEVEPPPGLVELNRTPSTPSPPPDDQPDAQPDDRASREPPGGAMVSRAV